MHLPKFHRKRSRLREILKKISSSDTTPRGIATGFAIGTFIAILPLFGFSIFVAMLVALLVPTLNKISLFGALALWNPITLIPVYSLSFTIGDFLLGQAPVISYEVRFIDHVYNISRRLIIGNVTIGVLCAILGYVILLRIVTLYRQKQ